MGCSSVNQARTAVWSDAAVELSRASPAVAANADILLLLMLRLPGSCTELSLTRCGGPQTPCFTRSHLALLLLLPAQFFHL